MNLVCNLRKKGVTFLLCLAALVIPVSTYEIIKENTLFKSEATALRAENALLLQKLKFEAAIHPQKYGVTAYVPFAGGINGSHKRPMASGRPVLSLAASREAFRQNIVRMGDFVVLVGRIDDKKGPEIKDVSLDILTPSLREAFAIGRRRMEFVNLSAKKAPYLNDISRIFNGQEITATELSGSLPKRR